jgi:hypothetical protein
MAAAQAGLTRRPRTRSSAARALAAAVVLLLALGLALPGAMPVRAQSPAATASPPPLPAPLPAPPSPTPNPNTGASPPGNVAGLPGTTTGPAPRGTPGPAGPASGAAGGSGADVDQKHLTITADHSDEIEFGDQAGVLVGEGHVHVHWRGYDVTSDRATWDDRHQIATFENNVVMNNGAETVYADYVWLNVATGEFNAREARTVVPEQLVQPNLLQPLRISGREVTHQGNVMTARDGVLTTCDYPDPHYRIGFALAILIPNRRLTLRDAIFYDSRDLPVLRIGYLSIPLSDRVRYTYLPQVGYDDEEGYYIKTAIGYTGSKQLPEGIFRLDLMSKLGVGLGIDQAYKFGRDVVGSFIIYGLQDRGTDTNDFNGRLNHQERFGDTILSLTSDFQNDSYTSISPQSKTQLSTVTVTRNVGASNTNLTLNLSDSSFAGLNSSSSLTYALDQTEKVSGFGNVSLKLNGSRDDSDTSDVLTSGAGTSNVRTEELGDLEATGRVGLFDLSMTVTKNLLSSVVSQESGQNTVMSDFSGTERLPDVTLGTDSRRLDILQGFPTKFVVGFGELIDGPPEDRVETERALFDVDMTPTYALTRGGRLSLSENGDFRQLFYSTEDAAQYILTDQTQLTQKFSARDSLSLTYGYLRPYGGEPIGFTVDETGSNNNVGANYTLTGGSAKVTLLTGYDVQAAHDEQLPVSDRDPWQDLSAQVALRASDKLQSAFTGTYDWNHGHLLTATNHTRIKSFHGPSLDVTLNYDPLTSRFSQITGTLETPLFRPDVGVSAYTSYNGITDRFDYEIFSLTKDYHDYQISIGYQNQPYGYRSQEGFNVSIRLKALPTFSQAPGGQFGSALDTGSSPVF